MRTPWIGYLALLLLAAQFNLTALVPLQIGDPPPPWWVGGRLLWPFAEETNTLLVSGDAVGVLTPILGAVSATCFLVAAYLLWRRISNRWFAWLIVAGAILSLPLQVIWFSIWAIPPIVVDIVLLWSMLGGDVTVDGLRRPAATN
jgi:hypothetical protein